MLDLKFLDQTCTHSKVSLHDTQTPNFLGLKGVRTSWYGRDGKRLAGPDTSLYSYCLLVGDWGKKVLTIFGQLKKRKNSSQGWWWLQHNLQFKFHVRIYCFRNWWQVDHDDYVLCKSSNFLNRGIIGSGTGILSTFTIATIIKYYYVVYHTDLKYLL